MNDQLSSAPSEDQHALEKQAYCAACTTERAALQQEVEPPENRVAVFAQLTIAGGKWEKLEPQDRQAEACQILCDYEIDKRERTPAFDLTSRPIQFVQRLVNQNLTTVSKDTAINDEEQQAQKEETVKQKKQSTQADYQNFISELIATPEWQKLSFIEQMNQLVTEPAVPETEKAKLRQFQKILDLSQAVPADQAIIEQRLNTLDFSQGIPSPTAFIQQAIFSSPEYDSGISAATQNAIATEFKLTPRSIKTGSDYTAAMSATKTNANGQVSPAFPESAPLKFRPGLEGFTSNNGQDEFMRATTSHGDRWQVEVTDWTPNDKALAAELLQLWAMTEEAGESGYLMSLTQLDWAATSRIDPLKLKDAAQIINATFGGFSGYNGEIFYGDDELNMIRWQAQLKTPKGDAARSDRNMSMTDDALKGLKIRDNEGNVDLDVLRAFGEYSRDNCFVTPDYEAVQIHLATLFPEKFKNDKNRRNF